MRPLGDDLTSLFGSAENTALVVAPFIRSAALGRLLDDIDKAVETVVVTRWRPLDLLAGASDLAVLDVTEARSIPLLLRHDLHAKLFAADDRCLVGSANVTGMALGWHIPCNLELLVPIDRATPSIVSFEAELLAGAIKATREHQRRLGDLVERLSAKSNIVIPEIADDRSTPGLLPSNWAPRTMNPEEFYYAYVGDFGRISRTVRPMVCDELDQLGIVPGMDEPEFRMWVSAAIGQTPLVVRVTEHIDREGAMTEQDFERLLVDIGVDVANYSPREGLRVLQRWLTHFLPSEYQTTQAAIKLIKARDV